MSVNWDEIIRAGIEKLESETENFGSKGCRKEDRPKNDYYERGESLYRQKKYQAAIAQYTQKINLNPKHYRAYLHRGASHFILGRKKQGIKDYDRVIQLQPDFADGYYYRGYAYKVLGDLASAIADFSRAIELNIDKSSVYYYRGAVYSYLGNYQAAVEDFTNLIEIEQNADRYYNRGVVYYLMAQYNDAIADLARAIALEPQFISAYLNLGNAYYEIDNCQQATKNYKKAQEIDADLDPQDEHGYYAKGISALQQENFAEGIKYLQEAAFICRETNNYTLSLRIARLIQDTEMAELE